MGDFEAAAQGPVAYGRRRARRVAYRRSNRGLARMLRALGLSGRR